MFYVTKKRKDIKEIHRFSLVLHSCSI